MKKQLSEATAAIFFVGWNVSAVVFRTMSNLFIATGFDPDIFLTIVLFL
jgi:hypothetical protein